MNKRFKVKDRAAEIHYFKTQVLPAAVSSADPSPCAEVQEVTGQCSAGETALWSRCYSCLRLSTCFQECGHQSLEERPRGLTVEKTWESGAVGVSKGRVEEKRLFRRGWRDQLNQFLDQFCTITTVSFNQCSMYRNHAELFFFFQEQAWELLIHKPWHPADRKHRQGSGKCRETWEWCAVTKSSTDIHNSISHPKSASVLYAGCSSALSEVFLRARGGCADAASSITAKLVPPIQ